MWLPNQWLWDNKQKAPIQFREIRLDLNGPAQFVYFDPSSEFHDILTIEYDDYRTEIGPRFSEMYSQDGKILGMF